MTDQKKKQYNAEYYRKNKEKWRHARKSQKKAMSRLDIQQRSLQYRKALSRSSDSNAKLAKRMISSAAAYNEATKAYQQSRGMEKQNLKKQRTQAGYRFIKSLLNIGDKNNPSLKQMSAKMLRDFRKARLQSSAKQFVRAILDS